ncbi:MAG: GNAT family N-acetyltransferase [Nocardioides sp.]
MNDTDIRVDRATNPERYLATDHLVWFDEVGSQSTDAQLVGVPEDQRFAAEVDGADTATYAGIYGVRPMGLSIPGADGPNLAPVAGLTWVGVHPDHRRRGLLTAMMRHHFEQTRSEGRALSALHASEPAIYGRHGYGLASLEQTVTLGRGTTFTAPGLEEAAAGIVTRLATITDDGMAARLRAIDLAAAGHEVGPIVGEQAFYDRWCEQTPESLRDKESRRVLIASRDGRDVGHAIFRREHKWDNGRPSAKVDCAGVSGEPAARLALFRRLVDLDLVGTVKVFEVGEHDLLHSWLDGPRGTGSLETYDSLWLRLVDLPAALAARSYDEDCDVVVEVTDRAAPWNAGRWQIRVQDGAAEVDSTEDDADLALSVDVLGAAYLGGGNLLAKLRAGRVTEHRPGAVRELWHAMRTDVLPAAATGF